MNQLLIWTIFKLVCPLSVVCINLAHIVEPLYHQHL